jgi:hypothetical protein
MYEHQNIIMEIQKCPATRTFYQRWGGGEKHVSKRGWVWKSCPHKGVGLGNVGPSWRGSFEMLYTWHGEWPPEGKPYHIISYHIKPDWHSLLVYTARCSLRVQLPSIYQNIGEQSTVTYLQHRWQQSEEKNIESLGFKDINFSISI